MAITKIHPIKATLKKALDYICNPLKTEGKLLVSSHGCAPETADIEFEMTRSYTGYKSSIVLARHLVQSFKPGEVTPEQAHELGKRLAEEVLGGRYEYVIATHVDKGHVHNHIIFNNVDMVDHKCYRSNRSTYHQLQKCSDRICEENGLSVIKNPVAKNISRKEFEERKRGTSSKGRLQHAIDGAIKNANSYQKFLSNMVAAGYEIKEGKYIAFRAEGQERFTRAKTIGENYTSEAIHQRIAEHRVSRRNHIYKPNILKINLLTEIRARLLSRSRNLSKWQKVRLVQETANTINFLTEKQISNLPELHDSITKLDAEYVQMRGTLKEIEGKLSTFSEAIGDLTKYQRLKPIAEQYQHVSNRGRFLQKYERELIVFEAAERALDVRGIKKDTSLEDLKRTYKRLLQHKNELFSSYEKLGRERQNMRNAQANIQTLCRSKASMQKVREKSPEK